MCGIAAIFAHGADAPPVREAELTVVRDAMAARGPDGSGLWIADDGRVGLAHRRLAIIDLSAEAAQPMTFAPDDGSPDGARNVRTRITYNGEIFNYRALRAWLESDGAVLRTQSDTEVLLHLYDRFGDAMVEHLRGMYAFAIWDEARRGVFLARDAFGIKPLYFADVAGTFRAASSVKALIAGGVDSEAARRTSASSCSAPEPHTCDIQALPAGTIGRRQARAALLRHTHGACGSAPQRVGRSSRSPSTRPPPSGGRRSGRRVFGVPSMSTAASPLSSPIGEGLAKRKGVVARRGSQSRTRWTRYRGAVAYPAGRAGQ